MFQKRSAHRLADDEVCNLLEEMAHLDASTEEYGKRLNAITTLSAALDLKKRQHVTGDSWVNGIFRMLSVAAIAFIEKSTVLNRNALAAMPKF